MIKTLKSGDAEVFLARTGRAFVCYYRDISVVNGIGIYEVEWFFKPDGKGFRKLLDGTHTLMDNQRTNNTWELFCPGVNEGGDVTRDGNTITYNDGEEFILTSLSFDIEKVQPLPATRTISSLWRSSDDTLFCATLLRWNDGTDSSLWLHTGQLGEPMQQLSVINTDRMWNGRKLIIETTEGTLSTTRLDVTFWKDDVELEELDKTKYEIRGIDENLTVVRRAVSSPPTVKPESSSRLLKLFRFGNQ
jgi:hypothetical protein